MLPAEDRIRLRHMLEESQKAQTWIATRSRANLSAGDPLSYALQRLIEIIGEAAKKVSPATRFKAPQIPWKEITGMRDRLIHAYHDVNLDILWNTVTEDLPPLIAGLESLLSEDPSS